MRKLKVMITNKQNSVKVPSGIRLLIRRCCHAVLENENFPLDAEVGVTFMDNEQIRQLNRDYRNKDKATDVLSFPMGEDGSYDKNEETGAYILGDIVISIEKAMEQSVIYGHSLRREIGFLTVHSMLHLMGYDHEQSPIGAMKMREKEEAVLLKLGLPRETVYSQFTEE